jgi:hypothetical protein
MEGCIMTIRSTLTTVLTAALTCTTLLVFTPASDLIAKTQSTPLRPASVVETEQVHLTLARITPEGKATDPSCLRIVARNKTDKPVTVSVVLTALTPAPPASPMSRMGPMPTVQWNETRSVSLNANESKTIDLKQTVAETWQVSMACGKKATLLPAIKAVELPTLKQAPKIAPTQQKTLQK